MKIFVLRRLAACLFAACVCGQSLALAQEADFLRLQRQANGGADRNVRALQGLGRAIPQPRKAIKPRVVEVKGEAAGAKAASSDGESAGRGGSAGRAGDEASSKSATSGSQQGSDSFVGPPEIPKKLPPRSAFEQQLSAYRDQLLDREILQFGYDVFGRELASGKDSPIGPNYVLSNDDKLQISIWGQMVDSDLDVTIDSKGQVRLEILGLVTLGGLTVEQAQAELRRRYDPVYNNYQLRVRVTEVSGMTVHVVGHVKHPGPVVVTSVASLFDALSEAGGITKEGSLRAIRLRRPGAEDVTLDLYDYLLEGEVSVDATLRHLGSVVVPPIGAQAAIVGSVLRPAIYELDTEGTNLAQLIDMGGGFSRMANRRVLQLESVGPSGLTVKQIELDKTPADQVKVADGDVLIVRNMQPRVDNVVYVVGNVATPGRYAFREGMRVSDLVNEDVLIEAGFWLGRRAPNFKAESPKELPEPFLDYALIRRIDPKTKQEERVAFHLGKAIEKDPVEDIELRSQDSLVVFPRSQFEAPETVFISGAVNIPGEQRYFAGMHLRDLVRIAGGLRLEAHLAKALLTRIHPDQTGARYEHIPVDLGKIMAGDTEANVVLEPNDSLSVKVIPEFRRALRVEVSGEVRHPGEYTVIPGERLSDILERVGGYTDDAYLPAAQFFSTRVRAVQQRSIEESLRRLELESKIAAQRFTAEAAATGELVDVESEQTRIDRLIETIRENPALGRRIIRIDEIAKLRGTEDDFELEDGDKLIIPRRPQDVHVIGAVVNQTSLLHRESRAAKQYLRDCGGQHDNADMDMAYVIRSDGTVDSARFARKNYRWDGRRGRYSRGDLLSLELFPGDTLVVPYDVKPQLSSLGLTKTITQILFQVALSTGVIVALL